MKFSLVLALVGASSTVAFPLPFSFKDAISDIIGGGGDSKKSAAPTPVSADELRNFARIAQFARASFCSTPVVKQWACGEACKANPQTKTIIAGGDNGQIPNYFVAFDPPSNSIVVAHQGTRMKNTDSLFNDVDFFFDDPSDINFPGAKDVKAKLHGGFQDAFNRTSKSVLDAVEGGIADFKATNVIVTGHSLGGAIGLLDTMFLAKRLDPSINIKTVLFGLPRTGNKEWANFVDRTVQDRKIDFRFFINGADPVPRLPPDTLGFRHPSGEIFQKNNTRSIETIQCPGQENKGCSASISLLKTNSAFHGGPYVGVKLGKSSCSI